MQIPTRTLPPISEEITPEAEQRLVQFCEEQIAKMQKSAHISNADGQPGFYELNQALMNYQSVNLALISIYAVAKTEFSQAKEAFEDWYATKYIQVRDELNPRSISTTKWYGAKEIEMQVRHQFNKEFRAMNDDLIFCEEKVSLLRRMLESWASHQYVLTQLSKNITAEIGGSSLE